MNEEPDSITGLVFYGMGGISAVIALVSMATGSVNPVVGIGALLGSASLWWMGKVVNLLARISSKLGEVTKPVTTQQGNAPSKATPAPARKDVPTYKID